VANITNPEDESLREIIVNLQPINELSISSMAGFFRKGDNASDRLNSLIRLSNEKNYSFEYNLDYVKSITSYSYSSWWRHKANAYYSFDKIKSGIEFLAEDKTDKLNSIDSLISTSLKYFDYAPYIQLGQYSGIGAILKYSLRDDYLPNNGIMINASQSLTPSFEINYSGIKEFNTNLVLTYRSKKYTDAFRLQGFLDNETILIRSRSKFLFWDPLLNGDFYYEVSTQKSAKLQKVFVRVPQGTGNYKYLGDLNNNGIADENEFELTPFDGDYILITIPTDELFPVIDLKTSTRWKVRFSKLFEQNSLADKILSPISTETFWRVEENSLDPDYANVYLLHLASFQNENTTIRGINYIQQDIYIFENKQDLSFRFRFAQNKALSKYNNGFERDYSRERSLRIKFKMVEEISNQTDIVNQVDNATVPVNSNGTRQINSNTLTSDFSYRPERNVEVGFKIKVGKSEDSYPIIPTIINLNSQLIRLNLSFLSTGRLRIELERDELIANTNINFIPYQLTYGNQIGKNYYWRLNFDYRLTSFLQTTLSYDGRLQGASRAIHTARAEARAYF
jgi:hypothetical protein